MIKNVIFDLGRVLVDFYPIEYIKKFNFNEEISEKLEKIIFFGDLWLDCDKGIYNNIEIVDILVEQNPELENEIRAV